MTRHGGLMALAMAIALLTAGLARGQIALPTTPGKPMAKADVVIPGLRFGMSQTEVHAILKSLHKNEDWPLIPGNSDMPLGLDVLQGATVHTVDSGVTMAKSQGYEPVYFHRGRLAAIKRTLRSIGEFTALKKEFPSGRFYFHTFPGRREPTRVFVAKDKGRLVFTNHQNHVYIFDEALRQEAASGVTGSVCWHGKTMGPNQQAFVSEYRACVASRQVSGNLVSQDAALCRKFCDNTPAAMKNAGCEGICGGAMGK